MDIPSIEHFLVVVAGTLWVTLVCWAVYYVSTMK